MPDTPSRIVVAVSFLPAPRTRPWSKPWERLAVASLAVSLAACVQSPPATVGMAAMAHSANPDSAIDGGCFPEVTASDNQAESRRPVNPGATFEAAWSMINERHFDTTFNGVDWAGVRAELLPRARQARST